VKEMLRNLLQVVLLLMGSTAFSLAEDPVFPTEKKLKITQTLSFEENLGQFTKSTQNSTSEILFKAQARGLDIYLTSAGLSYVFIRPKQAEQKNSVDSVVYEYSRFDLDEFAMINMNGRVYDPVIGRFIQPDNVIQAPDNLQNYNRYAYCFNNPLKFNDPSGHYGEDPTYGYYASGYSFGASAYGSTSYLGYTANYSASWSQSGYSSVTYDAQNITYSFGSSWSTSYGVSFQDQYVSWSQSVSFSGSFSTQNPSYITTQATEYYNKVMTDNANWATGTLGFITGDLVVPDPSDAALLKWAGYAVAGTVAGAYLYSGDYISKMSDEISGIAQRAAGPLGFTYELRVNRPGSYMDVRGNSVTLNTNDVWKYGETTQGFDRYTQQKLNTMVTGGVHMQPLYFGNQMEIKIAEKYYIYGHFFTTGSLPPGNSIFR
jgi:RHS repeat-associated protein